MNARKYIKRIPGLGHLLTAVLMTLGLPGAVATCSAACDELVANNLRWAATACPGYANTVEADIDGNGVDETLVVVQTLDGEAYGDGVFGYFYSGAKIHCGGVAPWPKGKLAIWFVNMTAAGYVRTSPSTWTYKSVPRVRVSVSSDASIIHGTWSTAYRTVNAYTERYQGGTVIGSYLYRAVDPDPDIQLCEFNSATGIKEVFISSDFTENLIMLLEVCSTSAALPAVTVSASDATAGEPGTVHGSGRFTFTRSGSTAAALTVKFTVGGSATSGADYTSIGTTVSFAANSSTATKTVSVINDSLAEGDETVVVTLASGTGYSIGIPNSATVTIKDDELSNNAFSAAIAISGPNGTATGSNVGATKETGEPNHAGNIGGKSVWWRWTAPYSGSVTFDTIGSTFDTLLAAYTGSTVSALTLKAANDDINGSLNRQSRITFSAVSGTTYRIAVDGYNSGSGAASGPITLNWWMRPQNDNFTSAISISGPSGSTTGSNLNGTKETGEPNHVGNAGGKSVWWRWTAPASGSVTIDTIGSNFDTLLAAYTGSTVAGLTQKAANDDINGALNRQSRITFNAVSGTTYRIAVDGYNAGSGAASGNVKLNWNMPSVSTATAWVTGITPGSLEHDNGGLRGLRLKTGASTVKVTALGRVYVSGNTQNHNLVLVNKATGATVASATWTPSGGVHNQIKYVNLAAPVTLAANTEYYLASQETSGGDYYHSYDTKVTTTGVATVLSAARNPSGTWSVVGTTGSTYGPVSFKYTTGSSDAVTAAAGIPPTAATTVEDKAAAIPPAAVALRATIEDGYLVLEYEQPVGPPDVTCILELSTNLTEWTAAQGEVESMAAPAIDGITRVRARFLTPVNEASMRYFRLRIVGDPR